MSEDDLVSFLPNEIIELILENKTLSIRDVAKFALTSKHFLRTVFESNRLWKTKFFQRFVQIL